MNIRYASDVSVLHSLGYQGWLIATLDNGILLESFVATDGRVEDTHSYRAEICGNITTLSFLNIIRRVYGFTPTSVEHVCDNQSDITASWKENTISVFDKTKPNANVIIVARSSISELQQFSTVKAFWVSIHADKRGPSYSKQEELNIMNDTLAERSQAELPDELKPRHDTRHFPEQQIYVVISHKKVTSRLSLYIANMIHGPALRTYTTPKEGWSSYTYEHVAWESFLTAFNKLCSSHQTTMTKTILIFW
jgi:hypothetical protein